MANIDCVSCGMLNPGPDSGWYRHTTRYGTSISSKLNHTRPSDGPFTRTRSVAFFGGSTQWQWRKAATDHYARVWVDGSSFNKSSIEANAGGIFFTNIKLQKASRSPFSLYMHLAQAYAARGNWPTYNVSPNSWLNPNWDMSGIPSEPDTPVITAAQWDGKRTGSVTLSNYNRFGAGNWEVFITSPAIGAWSGQHLYTLAWGEGMFLGSMVFPWDAAHTSGSLIPWPVGSPCTIAMRVWPQNHEASLPSAPGIFHFTVG